MALFVDPECTELRECLLGAHFAQSLNEAMDILHGSRDGLHGRGNVEHATLLGWYKACHELAFDHSLLPRVFTH